MWAGTVNMGAILRGFRRGRSPALQHLSKFYPQPCVGVQLRMLSCLQTTKHVHACRLAKGDGKAFGHVEDGSASGSAANWCKTLLLTGWAPQKPSHSHLPHDLHASW
jgi:hypothetical protein